MSNETTLEPLTAIFGSPFFLAQGMLGKAFRR